MWVQRTELGLLCGSPGGQISSPTTEGLVNRHPSSEREGRLPQGSSVLPVPRGKEGEHFARIWERGCVVS